MSSDPDQTAVFDSDERMTPRQRGSAEQFAPGTMIAGRYRISSILGAGGMGEVYRADDIRLDQPVALKFLPARLARDPILLGRLHDEVRLGRQIAHPNVCRIYDIVDWNGAQFVAMEYVDGEDLSRLLRRIGRIAHDKAVDIARGIAAGLMAAHAKGILHRDLKPANVMVDSRGEARVMDFGLALAAGEDDGTISGTPAYMAPEQLEGQQATVQSDLYALGLVMYELFTGRRAHTARTMPERIRDTSDIATPSSVIRDIDPAVERVILRCLSHDPAERPHSAREVIEWLPGGDPLAAAIAAGETPSPRIVAAAGAEGSLTPRAAWTLLALIAALLALFVVLRRESSFTRYLPMERSPDVLHQRAKEILQDLGISAAGESVRSFDESAAYSVWLIEQRGAERWERMRNGPSPLFYRVELGIDAQQSYVMPRFANAPGWRAIEVDTQGRLYHLLAAPRDDVQPRPLAWRPLLAAAGLDPAKLRPIAPRDAPAAPFDARAAWSGTYPNDATPIRVEAAAWKGTPVFFRVTGAWDEAKDPLRSRPFVNPRSEWFNDVLVFSVFGLALLVAWRNLHLRRGDRQGALRVALVVFVLSAIFSIVQAVHLGNAGNVAGFLGDRIGDAMVNAGIVFMAYIAIEPLARRRWPRQLIAWARLLAGRVRDPLVGRHVLIGIAAGLGHAVLAGAGFWVAARLFDADTALRTFTPPTGMAQALTRAFFTFDNGVRSGFAEMTTLVLLTMLLRKRALAIAALFALNLAFFMVAVGPRPQLAPAFVLVAALVVFVTVRYGLLAVAVLQGVAFLIMFTAPPVGPRWLVTYGLVPMTIVAALAVWAFVVSLGGQSPFDSSLLDE